MGKKHKKPTGELGSVIFGGGQPAQFRTIEFPSSKGNIEKMIVQAAISPSNELWRLYGILGPPSQNQENNLDFSLQTAAGKESLELMEIALLERNGRYSAAPLTYNQGIVADKIITQIEKKSKHYGTAGATPINLLLYCTDFRFCVSNDVLWLVSKWSCTKTHAFKSIVFVTFDDRRTINGTIIFPQDHGRDFSGIDEAGVRGTDILLADLASPISSADGNGVTLPLGRPKKDSLPNRPMGQSPPSATTGLAKISHVSLSIPPNRKQPRGPGRST